MSNLNAEELVSAYMSVRSEREKLLRQYEDADKALKLDLAQIEAAILEVCNTINADSIKTKYGTAMRKLNERFSCNDWENFYKFILDNEATHLLERRIHQGNIKNFLAEHEGDGLPPGVNVMREFNIVVRKSSEA
jgi:hypothetical protein